MLLKIINTQLQNGTLYSNTRLSLCYAFATIVLRFCYLFSTVQRYKVSLYSPNFLLLFLAENLHFYSNYNIMTDKEQLLANLPLYAKNLRFLLKKEDVTISKLERDMGWGKNSVHNI